MEENKIQYKHRQEEETQGMIRRLNRIEGQIRGIRNMVEEERYCIDILTQVSAVQSALNAFNKELLSSHIQSCVVERMQQGDTDVIDELCTTVKRFMK